MLMYVVVNWKRKYGYCSLSLSLSPSLSLSLQVKELYSTMQRYSAESEKMAQRREKQIDSLKQQLEDNEKSKVLLTSSKKVDYDLSTLHNLSLSLSLSLSLTYPPLFVLCTLLMCTGCR